VHFALGDNGTLLGRIRSKTHLDGVICKPTVLLDGKPIVEAGALKIGAQRER
jgi:leucyl aminopeptidase (aminopeptidase T)